MNNNFTTDKLLLLLDDIKKEIILENLSESTQERLWNTLNWNKKEPVNKEMIKYLFTGWWIYSAINNPI